MKHKNIAVLHGWAADHNKLKPFITNLESDGWKVFYPVLPGFGGKPLPKAYDLESYANFVISEADKKFSPGNYFLFGHSFGGRIAVKIAAGNENLSGTILCASGGFSRGSIFKRIIFYLLAKVGKLLTIYKPLGLLFKKILYKFAREHDYEKTSGYLKVTFRNVISENLKTTVAYLKQPLLILWGTKDRMTPYKDAQYIKRSVGNCKLISFENEGHTLPYTKPKELVYEIEKWYQSLS